MIPKNLKVGDTFVDGTSKFEVTAVNGSGDHVTYEAKRIAANVIQNTPEKAQKATEAPKEEAKLDSFNTYTKTEINRLKNDELEELCEQLGLEKDTGILMKKKIIDHLGL